MEKPIAVVLHGYPAEENQSTPIGKLLKELGYEVIVPKYMECNEEFSIEWIQREIEKMTGGRVPEVLVGVSLGGMVLPYLALECPDAKMIFVATAARFRPKMKLAEGAVKMATKKLGLNVVEWVARMPDSILEQIYNLVHKAKTQEDREFCVKDKKAIIEALRKIKPYKHGELARFILNVDNTGILKNIENKTLVLSGARDVLMPTDMGRELADGIKGAKFNIVEAEHFNVLNQEALNAVRKFLT